MKCLLTAFTLLYCTLCFSQTPKDIVIEGVALHDDQQYDAALVKYDEAIKLDPDYYLAHYEKTVTFLTQKKYDECIKLCKWLLKKFPEGDDNASVYVNYGSALDMKGKKKDAIETFDKGIKAFPEFGMLYFNKAITLTNMNEVKSANEAAETSVRLNPKHGSSHHLLSILNEDNKVYTLLASLFYLTRDVSSERAIYHLSQVEKIISSNVSKGDGKGMVINLSISPDGSTAANDFSLVEMSMAISTSLNSNEAFAFESKTSRLQRNLQQTLNGLKADSTRKRDGFGWSFYAPFFYELSNSPHMETFVHLITASADDKENMEWLEANEEKIERFVEFTNTYAYKK